MHHCVVCCNQALDEQSSSLSRGGCSTAATPSRGSVDHKDEMSEMQQYSEKILGENVEMHNSVHAYPSAFTHSAFAHSRGGAVGMSERALEARVRMLEARVLELSEIAGRPPPSASDISGVKRIHQLEEKVRPSRVRLFECGGVFESLSILGIHTSTCAVYADLSREFAVFHILGCIKFASRTIYADLYHVPVSAHLYRICGRAILVAHRFVTSLISRRPAQAVTPHFQRHQYPHSSDQMPPPPPTPLVSLRTRQTLTCQ